ncbi:YcbK family protein [Tunturiibacter gelidiferens]|uniref:YcbK family protein n=1 Tax=Tunturiibacter gelidiferens TaxID=3069689 RepID=UPI003D9ADDB8
MQRLRANGFTVGAAITLLMFGVPGLSWAKIVRTRVHAGLHTTLHSSARSKTQSAAITGEEVVPGVMPDDISSGAVSGELPDDGKPYQLRMTNLHTGESLDVIYRIGDTYIPEALEKLNYFLRDHNTQDVVHYEPKEFDVLHALMSRLGQASGVINVVCGYRTPETNAALRHGSPKTGVAEHSQHMEGHAIDLRVPGVSTEQLRNTALSLHAGGVGYYPISQFVHVDVGPVREWAFGATPHRPGRRTHGGRATGM